MVSLNMWKMAKYCFSIFLRNLTPNHVAFILDGNRRYARLHSFESVIDGHKKGAEAVLNIIPLLKNLGIKYVSLFIFSRDNFLRKGEVENMMELLHQNFHKEKQWLYNLNAKILISGDMNLLPENIKAILNEIVNETKDKNEMILNLCCAYSCSTEIEKSLRTFSKEFVDIREDVYFKEDIKDGSHKNIMESTKLGCTTDRNKPFYVKFEDLYDCDIDSHILNYKLKIREFWQCLYNPQIPPPKILIRTSGETRLSDFLFYQACFNTKIYFIETLWPAINRFTIIFVIIHYLLFYN